VPGGGLEITGVLSALSLLLQPVNKIKVQRKMLAQRRKDAKVLLWFSFAPLRLCARPVLVVIDSRTFILFLGKRLTGHAILTLNPPAEIDKLAPLGTEGTKRNIFPLDRLTAGWAFHDLEATKRPRLTKEMRVV